MLLLTVTVVTSEFMAIVAEEKLSGNATEIQNKYIKKKKSTLHDLKELSRLNFWIKNVDLVGMTPLKKLKLYQVFGKMLFR